MGAMARLAALVGTDYFLEAQGTTTKYTVLHEVQTLQSAF